MLRQIYRNRHPYIDFSDSAPTLLPPWGDNLNRNSNPKKRRTRISQKLSEKSSKESDFSGMEKEKSARLFQEIWNVERILIQFFEISNIDSHPLKSGPRNRASMQNKEQKLFHQFARRSGRIVDAFWASVSASDFAYNLHHFHAGVVSHRRKHVPFYLPLALPQPIGYTFLRTLWSVIRKHQVRKEAE